jgi:N-acetylneuraminate synthase/N,N'-diacetyllegionaminate synthase
MSAEPGTIRFGSRRIGSGQPVVVIAEIGVNHEGDAELCLELVEQAARAGADAIKLQTLDADENYVPGTESHAVFARAQLDRQATAAAFERARAFGMEALTTCGDMATLAWVDALNPAAHKISSGLITHLPLIRAAAATGRPLLVSTGMSDLETARKAAETARSAGAEELCFLQCTSIYPAPPETLNLRGIATLSRELGVPAGYSDHSLGFEAAALAVAAGAVVIEKHFSLDPAREGFDHRLSVDPAGLRELVQAVRRAETMLGTPGKAFSDQQAAAANRYLRSIVARRDIAPGEPLSLDNVGFMRTVPERRGLPPGEWESLCGCIAARAIRRYQTIQPEDLVPRD